MRTASAIYLALQGALTAAWWALLFLSPPLRALFKPQSSPDITLLSFWLADLGCIAVGSGVAAWLLWRRDRWSAPALWFTSGSVVYAALYCATMTLITGEATLATALMVPAAIITVWIALRSSAA